MARPPLRPCSTAPIVHARTTIEALFVRLAVIATTGKEPPAPRIWLGIPALDEALGRVGPIEPGHVAVVSGLGDDAADLLRGGLIALARGEPASAPSVLWVQPTANEARFGERWLAATVATPPPELRRLARGDGGWSRVARSIKLLDQLDVQIVVPGGLRAGELGELVQRWRGARDASAPPRAELVVVDALDELREVRRARHRWWGRQDALIELHEVAADRQVAIAAMVSAGPREHASDARLAAQALRQTKRSCCALSLTDWLVSVHRGFEPLARVEVGRFGHDDAVIDVEVRGGRRFAGVLVPGDA